MTSLEKGIMRDLIANALGKAPRPAYADGFKEDWELTVAMVEAGLDVSAHTAGENDLCIITNCGEADATLDCAIENIMEHLAKRMLMNPATGSVDCDAYWRNEYESLMADGEDGIIMWGGAKFEDAGLIEVRKNEHGDWVEA